MSERIYDKPGTAQYGDEPAAEAPESNESPADAEPADEAGAASDDQPEGVAPA